MQRWRRFLLITATIAGLAVIFHLAQVHGLDPIRNQVERLGVWAPIAIVLLRGVSILLPALPSTAYSLLAGTLLGFETGFITIVIADLLFCQAAFLLARHYGRGLIAPLVGQGAMARIEGVGRDQFQGNPFLLTGLLMTGLFDFVSYAAGLSGTPWRAFALPLLVSVLLSDAPIVALGAGLFDGGRLILGLALLGVFALAVVAGLVKRRTQHNQDLTRQQALNRTEVPAVHHSGAGPDREESHPY